MKRVLSELVLPFLVTWLVATIFVDIIAIPTVFRNIDNLEVGGRIGMTIFGSFNIFEIIFGLIVIAGILNADFKTKSLVGLSFILFAFSLLYKFYMTPTIAQTSMEMHKVAVTDPLYQTFRAKLNDYHVYYRYLDTTKMILLIAYATMVIKKKISGKEIV